MGLAFAVEIESQRQSSERDEIVHRMTNWGNFYRLRSRGGQSLSFEGRYRSGQSEHWEYGQAPPTVRADLDPLDAELINRAWQSIADAFHQTLLGAWYVKQWSEPKCLRVAKENAGYQVTRRSTDITPHLAMGHCLIREQLAIPAVIRRDRLVARTRAALDLPAFGTDNVAGDA